MKAARKKRLYLVLLMVVGIGVAVGALAQALAPLAASAGPDAARVLAAGAGLAVAIGASLLGAGQKEEAGEKKTESDQDETHWRLPRAEPHGGGSTRK